MKCASTTIHTDLSKHPEIYCGKKELNALTDSDGTAAGISLSQDAYQRNYASPRNDHDSTGQHGTSRKFGDVSTTYSMLPLHKGVAKKAKQICDSDLKIIYIVRNPILRAISHHQHMMNQPHPHGMGPDINVEIRRQPSLIAYSSYAMQLKPWIREFGLENIHVVKFEEYVANRQRTLGPLFEFLGLHPHEIEIDPDGSNRSDKARVAGPFVQRVYRSSVFQRHIHGITPDWVRLGLRRLLLKKAKQVTIPPNNETLDFIHQSVHDDTEEFCRMVGWPHLSWPIPTAPADACDSSRSETATSSQPNKQVRVK